MSVLTVRGGIPYVFRGDVTTGIAPLGGRKLRLPFYINFVQIRIESGNPVRLYFTEADYQNDENYVLVTVASPTYGTGSWEGPVETCAGDHSDLWLRGQGGTAEVQLVAYQRRG